MSAASSCSAESRFCTVFKKRFTWLSSLKSSSRTRGSQTGPITWCRALRYCRALRFLLCLQSLLSAEVIIYMEDSSPGTRPAPKRSGAGSRDTSGSELHLTTDDEGLAKKCEFELRTRSGPLSCCLGEPSSTPGRRGHSGIRGWPAQGPMPVPTSPRAKALQAATAAGRVRSWDPLLASDLAASAEVAKPRGRRVLSRFPTVEGEDCLPR